LEMFTKGELSKMEMIKFKGKNYVLIEGALTTKEAYKNGRASYAHLFEDGKVRRFGEVIGSKEDIEFSGLKVEIEPSPEGIFSLLMGIGWLD